MHNSIIVVSQPPQEKEDASSIMNMILFRNPWSQDYVPLSNKIPGRGRGPFLKAGKFLKPSK